MVRGWSSLAEGESFCAVAVWRLIENTYEGRRLYVDDLVTMKPVVRAASADSCLAGCNVRGSWLVTCWRSIPAFSAAAPQILFS